MYQEKGAQKNSPGASRPVFQGIADLFTKGRDKDGSAHLAENSFFRLSKCSSFLFSYSGYFFSQCSFFFSYSSFFGLSSFFSSAVLMKEARFAKSGSRFSLEPDS